MPIGAVLELRSQANVPCLVNLFLWVISWSLIESIKVFEKNITYSFLGEVSL